MSTGRKSKKFAGVFFLCIAVLFLGSLSLADAAAARSQKKTKKPAQPALPTLPSGPTGQPVQQMPLDTIAPVPPQVNYQNGQLTIVAPNSTLGDILRAVRKQTGAEIEVPDAKERVVTHLGPGPARDVMAELLNGSRFNYVLLGSPADSESLTRVVLVAKSSGPDNSSPNNNPGAPPQQPMPQPGVALNQQEMGVDANDAAEATDDTANADDNADQNNGGAENDQQAPPPQPDQPGVKTPQQMLQEMQQRQLQMQQNQPQGQPPIPGPGVPPRPQDQ